MKNIMLPAAAVALFASATGAIAEDGFYFGVAIGTVDLQSESGGIGATEGNDLTLGGVVGHRWDQDGGNSISVELSLDASTGDLMEGADYVGDACIDQSPDWCNVDYMARIRGVYGIGLQNDFELLFAFGLAVADGVAEDGGGNYPSTVGTGTTIGVGLQKTTGNGTFRAELNYDRLGDASPEAFDKSLEIISLRAVALF